ncbi:diguanylate cyclase [Catenovulum sediminis]|uniref:diguanylate cyclase n=1 Tax=Catenovulum sediminis TaxID=1740262 RepID=UPI001C8F987A|nr:diguanylate cyclase [Catenovulum sediminis]
MRIKLFILPLVLVSVCFGNAVYAAKTIMHAQAHNPKETLIANILKLALEKSSSNDNYFFKEWHETLNEARLMSMLEDGALQVAWAGTQKQYEEKYFPIRVPVLKGLLGHRIFIIRQDTQAMFNDVHTLEDLRKIKLGQGKFWGDTFVLKHNGLKVVDPVKYNNLFYMLEGGRFDFFPRAVHEPWGEVESRPELKLTVEKNILLIYPFAMYFFVAKDNAKLGRLIEEGFRNAIYDGSFNEMFYNHPLTKEILKLSKLKSRRIIRLENPNMSELTPFDEKALWLNIDELEY